MASTAQESYEKAHAGNRNGGQVDGKAAWSAREAELGLPEAPHGYRRALAADKEVSTTGKLDNDLVNGEEAPDASHTAHSDHENPDEDSTRNALYNLVEVVKLDDGHRIGGKWSVARRDSDEHFAVAHHTDEVVEVLRSDP
jgi:hypothetical protein